MKRKCWVICGDYRSLFYIFKKLISGANDNPTAQQFGSAYRKLLLHNEITCGKGANCLNDVTKLLEVSSRKKYTVNTEAIANTAELEMLANFDFEYGNDCEPHELVEDEAIDSTNITNAIQPLEENSLALMAALVEEKVIRAISNKGKKTCGKCIQVFTENELANDDLIAFKSKTCNILQPCRSTLKLIKYVEAALKRYASQNASFQSILTHIVGNIEPFSFYDFSTLDETHNHHLELIKQIITTYLDLKSKNYSRIITRLFQEKLIRHEKSKAVHRAGQ